MSFTILLIHMWTVPCLLPLSSMVFIFASLPCDCELCSISLITVLKDKSGAFFCACSKVSKAAIPFVKSPNALHPSCLCILSFPTSMFALAYKLISAKWVSWNGNINFYAYVHVSCSGREGRGRDGGVRWNKISEHMYIAPGCTVMERLQDKHNV